MYPAYTGRPCVRPNVGSSEQSIIQLLKSADTKQILCSTASSIVVLLNDRLYFRPIARWGRPHESNPSFGGLGTCSWAPDRTHIYSVAADGFHVCIFELKTTTGSPVSPNPSSGKKLKEDRRIAERPANSKGLKFFSHLFQVQSALGSHESLASNARDTSAPLLEITLKKNQVADESGSFTQLKKQLHLPRRVAQVSVFSLPLRIRSIYIPDVLWQDISLPIICALRQQPGFLLLDASPQGKGVKSVLYLSSLCLRRIQTVVLNGLNTAFFVSLKQCWKSASSAESSAGRWPSVYAPEGSGIKHNNFLSLLRAPLERKFQMKPDWTKAAKDPDDSIIAGGVTNVCVSLGLNCIFIGLNTEWAFLLRYAPSKPKAEGNSSPAETADQVTDIDSERAKIGKCVATGVNGIVACAFLESRGEVAFLHLDGLVEIFSLDIWFHTDPLPLHRWSLDFTFRQALIFGAPTFEWNTRGSAFMVAFDNTIKVSTRCGLRLLEDINVQSDVSTIPGIWIRDDSTLLAGIHTDLVSFNFLVNATGGPDGGISNPWTNIDTYRSPDELVYAVEGDGDPLRPALKTTPIPLSVSECRHIHVSPDGRSVLLNASSHILLGSLRASEPTWGRFWETQSEKSALLFRRFPLDSSGPCGWYLNDCLYFTATHIPQTSSHIMFVLIFIKVAIGSEPDKLRISLAGCTNPSALRPLRICLLDGGHQWRSSQVLGHANKLLQQLASPIGRAQFGVATSSGSLLFAEPPIGVLFSDSSFACYRPHQLVASCKSNLRCSKVPDEFPRDDCWCFETVYVCHTKLTRPLELRFVIDIFTLLIRDASSRLRLGHLVSSATGDSPLGLRLYPKPISLTSPTLMLSKPLTDEMCDSARLVVSANRLETPFPPIISRPLHEFEYCFQTRGDAVVGGLSVSSSQGPPTHSEDSLTSGRPREKSASLTSRIRDVRMLPSPKSPRSTIRRQRLKPSASHRTVSHVAELKDHADAFIKRSAWNYVSGALAARDTASLQLSASSSSCTIPVSTEISSDPYPVGAPVLWKGETTSRPDGAASVENSSHTQPRHPSEVLKMVQEALTSWKEECNNADPLEKALLNHEQCIDNFAWGGVEFVVATPSQVLLLLISTSIYPFSPSSPIACRRSDFFEKKRLNGRSYKSLSGSLSRSDDNCGVEDLDVWTQHYSVRTVVLLKNPGAEVGAIMVSSRPLNTISLMSTHTLQSSFPHARVPQGLAIDKYGMSLLTGWHDCLVVDYPFNVRILLHQLSEPAFYVGGITRTLQVASSFVCCSASDKSLSAFWGCNITSVNLFKAIEEAVFLCLCKCNAAMRVHELMKDSSVPSIVSIEDLLEKSLSLPEIMVLRFLLARLKYWPDRCFKILTRISRIHEPLLSPFILFPLAGETVQSAFEKLMQTNELRTAMALLLPLQQVVGPAPLRAQFVSELIYQGCVQNDIPLIVDLISFSRQATFFPTELWKFGAGSSLDAAILKAVEFLLAKCQWRNLMSLVVELRLDFAQWLQFLSRDAKAKWAGESDLEETEISVIIESIRDAFWIFHRRVSLLETQSDSLKTDCFTVIATGNCIVTFFRSRNSRELRSDQSTGVRRDKKSFS
eukprot:Gregarina_sp_Poly_1__3028@NODE_184_length_11778_cov_104_566988_g164_i0_p1_GENE_NODE_184_length_11778_cov_104_566988_g164_i0NODE_184_length_11778_cov_104_566988_g164_i0_p1_ORF_typecomplete_len1600_score217_96RIC1/PF07064_13/0_00012_NODE_184_length_11778_cov_104_566988_g164_i012796078